MARPAAPDVNRQRALLADQATAGTIPRVTKNMIMGGYVITRRPAGGGGGGTLRSRAVHVLHGLVVVEEQAGRAAGDGGRVAPALESAPIALEVGAAQSRAKGSIAVSRSIKSSGIVRGRLRSVPEAERSATGSANTTFRTEEIGPLRALASSRAGSRVRGGSIEAARIQATGADSKAAKQGKPIVSDGAKLKTAAGRSSSGGTCSFFSQAAALGRRSVLRGADVDGGAAQVVPSRNRRAARPTVSARFTGGGGRSPAGPPRAITGPISTRA